MTQEVDAVYENGVLRPLQPLTLKESAKVRLSISEGAAPKDRTAYSLLEYARARTAALTHVPTLEEVQESLSEIEGSMSELIIAERGEY